MGILNTQQDITLHNKEGIVNNERRGDYRKY